MQENENQIIDAEFTEIERPKTDDVFNPVVFLTTALYQAGLVTEAVAWAKGIDKRAVDAESEKDRIFFANRSLRLFLSEVEDRENVTPRMLLADGIDSPKWIALMEQGVIPWLLNQFDKKGKRVSPEAETEESVVIGIDAAAEGTTDMTAIVSDVSSSEAAPCAMITAIQDGAFEIATHGDTTRITHTDVTGIRTEADVNCSVVTGA